MFIEKWWGSQGRVSVRKKGDYDSSAVRGECMLWTGPWDTTCCGGKARLQGLKRGQKETQEFGDEATLSWKGGRISFSTYLSECSRIPGAFGGISSNVNNRRSWWLSLWTAVLDCKASLGTIEFLEGRKVDCGEQRDKVENGIFNNSRPFLLMEHSGLPGLLGKYVLLQYALKWVFSPLKFE